MRKFSWIIPALLFLAIGASPARADTFDWTYTDTTNGVTGAGTLTTGAFSGGQALINSVTGTFQGVTIGALLAPGTFPNCGVGCANDNILYSAGNPYLDFEGFSFTPTGQNPVNIYWYGAKSTYRACSGALSSTCYNISTAGSFSVTPIAAPEPGTLVLLLFGLVALVLVRKRMARGLQPVT